MDDFFTPPPPPEVEEHRHVRYRTPEWFGAPDNYLPALVPVEVTIGRSEQAVVHMSGIRAFPAGWAFSLVTMTEPGMHEENGWDDPSEMMHRHVHRRPKAGAALPDELMRFGFEFPDGRRATSIDGHWGGERDEDGRPKNPVLQQGGGGGGGSRWEWDFWCWPIPDEGKLKIVCEWPAKGIERTETKIDASVIRDAASRAERLWPDPPEHPEGPGHW